MSTHFQRRKNDRESYLWRRQSGSHASLGLFGDENLTGIISPFNKINPIFAVQNQAQIYGMAVLETHQKKIWKGFS